MRVSGLRVATLMYVLGDDRVYAILLDQSGNRQRFELAPWSVVGPRIDTLWAALQGDFSPLDANAMLVAFASDWGRDLLPPAPALEPFDILAIVPHHVLHGLPLHAIRLGDDRRPLAATHGVTYCSSATLLVRCIDRNPVRAGDLAAWTFEDADGPPAAAPAVPQLCLAIGADVIGDKSPLYKELAETFAKSFPASVVFDPGTRFIKTRITNDDKVEAVCIVSHGYRDNDIADNSGLLIPMDELGVAMIPIAFDEKRRYHFRDLPFRYLPSAIETEHRADLMTISELKVGVETRAQLVALFACHSGAGQVLVGDDFDSFGYQWLKAGAASVIGNLWELDIDFALDWAPAFLRNWLVLRQPKALAYRNAVRTILARDPQPSVFEWATIALMGDWL
jgi:hypothetical protein